MSSNLPVPALTGEVLDPPAPALPVPAQAAERRAIWLRLEPHGGAPTGSGLTIRKVLRGHDRLLDRGRLNETSGAVDICLQDEQSGRHSTPRPVP